MQRASLSVRESEVTTAAELLLDLPPSRADLDFLPRGAGIRRSRIAAVNTDAREAGLARDASTWMLPVELFADRKVQLDLRHSEQQLQTRVWTGTVAGIPGSRATMAVNADAVSATVRLPDATFQVNGVADGMYAVVELAPSSESVHSEGGLPASGGLGVARGPASTTTDDGTLVDVLVAYTTAARGAQSTGQMEARIAQLVAEWNQVHLANSQGGNPNLRLVKTLEVVHTQNLASMASDLEALTSSIDGKMDEIHGLRAQYGADLVHLLLPDKTSANSTGLAWRPSAANQFHLGSGFSVSALPYSGAPFYSFIHELAHNFGAVHGNSAADLGFPTYNRGWWLSGTPGSGEAGTIMTSAGWRRPYFSNPNVTDPEVGLPLGKSAGSPGEAHAARGISENAFRVAAYTTSLNAPSAPSQLSATATSSSEVLLGWTDNSADEEGFRVEVSVAGGPFAEVGPVAQNQTSVPIRNLNPETQYGFRVRAFRGALTSDATNTAQATTPAEGPLPAPSDLSPTAVTRARVSLSWTDNSLDELGFRIERRVGAGSYQRLAEVESGTGTYEDTTVLPGTTYSYRVCAFRVSGPSPFSNELEVGTPEGAAGSVQLQAGWNLVSVPVVEVDALTLGTGVLPAAFAWNPALARYELVDLQSVSSVSAGAGTDRGLWVYSTSASAISYVGRGAAGSDADQEVTLGAGWNLLAYPLGQSCTFSDVQVRSSGGAFRTLGTSTSNTVPRPNPDILLFGTGFAFGGGSYQPADFSAGSGTFQVGRAMWVYVHEAGVVLRYPVQP